MAWYDPTDREHGGTGWKKMVVKNSSICEELGNIDTVFSDKTGTLTANKMEVTAVSVGGVLYRDVTNSGSAATQGQASSSTPPLPAYDASAMNDTASSTAGMHRPTPSRDILSATGVDLPHPSSSSSSSTAGLKSSSSAAASLAEIGLTPRDHVVVDKSGAGKIYTFEAYQALPVIPDTEDDAGKKSPAVNGSASPEPNSSLSGSSSGGGMARRPSSLFVPSPSPHQASSHSPRSTPVRLHVHPEEENSPSVHQQPHTALPLGSPARLARRVSYSASGRRLAADESPRMPTFHPHHKNILGSPSSVILSPVFSEQPPSTTANAAPSTTAGVAATQAKVDRASSPTNSLLQTDLILQDLVSRAFSSLKPHDSSGPADSIEMDYLLDLLCCNSVTPLVKKKRHHIDGIVSPISPDMSSSGSENEEEDDDETHGGAGLEEDDEEGDARAGEGQDTIGVNGARAHRSGSLKSHLNDNATTSSATSTPVPFRTKSVGNEADAAENGGAQHHQQHPIFELTPHKSKKPLKRAHSSPHHPSAQYTFSSSSPDEIALCEALDRCGLTLVGRKGNEVTIRYTAGGNSPIFLRYAIKATLEFTSTLARMDVVLQTPEGKLKIFVKGSDQRVLRMVTGHVGKRPIKQGAVDPALLLETTTLQLGAFAETGARTLLMAGATLSATSFQRFQAAYDAASNSLTDREAAIERAFVALENEGLDLLGSSSVSDQLQEGVPEAVDFLLKGGIKVVVLTGDRLETARAIGQECRLLQPYMRILQIGASSSEENIHAQLVENLRIVREEPPTDEAGRVGAEQARIRMGGDPLTPLPPVVADKNIPLLGYALAIDGSSLEVCLRHYKSEFIALFLHTATIISYRSTPRQKALAVQVVKLELGKTTLAIGDGANDVSMIQE
jgi:phosphoserine phosphatase